MNQQQFYAVKVNGQIVSPPTNSASVATGYISQLCEAHQQIAEVVAVTKDGKEILMG